MKTNPRLAALRRFAFAITLLNVLGHTWFGFEQSIAQPLVAIFTAYAVELLLEWLSAKAEGRRPRFAGEESLPDFLLSAHISGLAVAMLLYANDRLVPVAFAAAVAIASKYLVRATVAGRVRHVFNPSNLGITATLLCFHWVGIAPPYMFTENLYGWGDWILPGIIVCSGSFLNAKFTRRVPLILAWVGVFVLQAVARHLLFGSQLTGALMPMTGVAFLLFTFYMVTDPGTTPRSTRGQIAFGASVAVAYGVLMSVHVVFGIFFALSAVCLARYAGLTVQAWAARRVPGRLATEAVPAAGVASRIGP